MLINESNLVPIQLLNGLQARYFVQNYRNIPIRLEIDISHTGGWFLNLFVSRIDDQIYRYLVEVSETRLKLISRGEMSIDYAFCHPENGIYFAALFDSEQRITKLSWLYPSVLEPNLIASDQYITFDLDFTNAPFDLVEHAKRRGKNVLEIKSGSNIPKSNLKYGYVRRLLIPFSELVKTALLDHNPRLSHSKVEDSLNFGYSYIGIGTLHALIELNYQADLFGFNVELENLSGLFSLFQADDPEEIFNAIRFFKNKKIIPEYIRLLRSIAKSNASFTFKMATPFQLKGTVSFDWARAQVIKNIIEATLPETEFDEIVWGTLTCLDLENKKRPVFSLKSLNYSQLYTGFIDPSLDDRLNHLDFQFGKKIYECSIKVIFVPESLKNSEQYRYTLLRIEEFNG
jgi:hypothetical protein